MMCVDLGERLIKIIITVQKAYNDHHDCIMCTHILILHAHACISIVLLQTRDALKEEVSQHGLNIIHSASFPTDQNPQPFVQSLQVSNCIEITQCCCKLVYFLHICTGVKWKDHFSKLLSKICTRDSLPGMC